MSKNKQVRLSQLIVVILTFLVISASPVHALENLLDADAEPVVDEQVVEELTGMTGMVVRPVLSSLRDFLDVMKTVWIDSREGVVKNGEKNVGPDVVEP